MSSPGATVTVRTERAGRLMTITLDRPGQANALDMSTACQLRDAVRLIDGGVGCVLLRADITVAAESARFRSAYSAIGLSPDCGLTWTLPRKVGRARAADLMLTNRPVGAAEAASIGLVARVVPDDVLLAQAQALALELASGPTTAFGRIAKLLDSSGTSTLAEQLGAEAASIAACADHPEGRSGVAAFTAGRKPVFY